MQSYRIYVTVAGRNMRPLFVGVASKEIIINSCLIKGGIKMDEHIFTGIQKKKFQSIGTYSQLYGIFILLLSLWVFFAGVFLLITGGSESLLSGKPIGRAIGFIFWAIVGFLLGIYNLRMSKKFKLIMKEGRELNTLMEGIDNLFVIYKIYWVLCILAIFVIGSSFLLWGILPLLRK